jgi:hypothetical protein
MKFSDIQDSVQQAWQFIFPPFINLFILAFETFYITPQLLPQFIAKSTSGNFYFLIDPSFQQAIEFYGINKLFPFFILIGLVFILYFVQVFVGNIGHILPGHLSYSNYDLLIHSTSSSTLVDWWSKYPDLDIWALLGLLENRLKRQPVERLLDIKYWEEKFSKYVTMFNTVKVYTVWALLVPLFSRWIGSNGINSTGKVFAIVILLLFIQVFIFFKIVYALEQIGFAKVFGINDFLVNDTTLAKTDTTVIEQKQKLIFSDAWVKKFQKNWWTFEIISLQEFRWVIKNFIKKDISPKTTADSKKRTKKNSL